MAKIGSVVRCVEDGRALGREMHAFFCRFLFVDVYSPRERMIAGHKSLSY